MVHKRDGAVHPPDRAADAVTTNEKQLLRQWVALLLAVGVLAGCGRAPDDWVYGPVADQESVVAPAASPDAMAPSSVASPMPMPRPTPTAENKSADTGPITCTLPMADHVGDARVLAHYMVWYKTPAVSGRWQHWGWDPDGDLGDDPEDRLPDRILDGGRHQLASAHYPAIGPYDSTDPDLVEYHVALAWAAGIDGFVVDWYGPEDRGETDAAFATLLRVVQDWRAAYGLPFHVAITYEEKILRNVPVAERGARLGEDLGYILARYAGQEGYLRYQDLPLIFYFQIWVDGRVGLLRPDQIQVGRAAAPDFYLLYMGPEQEFMPISDGFYSWVSGTNADPADWGQEYANWVYPAMDYQTNLHDLTLNIGSVWAGFDDSQVQGWGSGARFIDRQAGAVYDQTWRLALASQLDAGAGEASWVQIVTWNDWNEGSEIEPSREHGDRYLAATQAYSACYTGRTLSPAALAIPGRIYAARKKSAGTEAATGVEELIPRVYAHFFAGDYVAAGALLDRAGY